MKKIAIIGECMIELCGEPFGAMRQGFGGDTLNTAVYLARVTPKERSEIHYISALGTDKLSEQMCTAWQQEGIHTRYVLRDEKRQPGLYLIQTDENGERTFLYWRNQSAAAYMLQHTKAADILAKLTEFDLIYLSGISLAILPKTDRTLLIDQLINAVKQGVELVFDGNFRPNLWSSVADAQADYARLLPFIRLALVTFEDEQQLWGDHAVTDTITRLHQIGIPKIAVKQGKEGVVFAENGNRVHIPAETVKNVVDTTSAGDAFNAGFLNGYLQGKPPEICCLQGNRLAAVVIQHRGAIIDAAHTQHFLTEFNQ